LKKSEIREKINGPVFSIVTPFLENDDIDYNSLESYINMVYDAGGRIYYAMAYNSRYCQLSNDEIFELNEFIIKTVKQLNDKNIVIVGDPLHTSSKVSLDYSLHAQKLGADLISLIFREKYYSDEQVYNHFNFIAKNSEIGILIHGMPFLSGYGGPVINYPISLLDRLADIPSVMAIKEDSKLDQYSHDAINKIKDRLSIIISGGGKRQWLKVAEKGCRSWLNGIGVFEPILPTLFWNCYLKGDKENYQKIINDIEVPFFEKGVSKYGWHLTIKAALEHKGLMTRKERMPLLALNKKDYHDVCKLIEKLPVESLIDDIRNDF